jgi:tetratricopeptide (TPR) repeat protein|tara:strand:- start:247 stop:759 length:513 start_codon:yes stop_codon:yes gene_type:complete
MKVFKKSRMFIFLLSLIISLNIYAGDNKNYCFSPNQDMGDSTYWASSAIDFFTAGNYEKVIEVVDSCFEYYAEDAIYQQNKLKNANAPIPPEGIVGYFEREQVFANYALNDLSMALWSKARSAEKLGKKDVAMDAYSKCIFLEYGRAWDPKGWFWNPSKDCIKRGRGLLK